MESNVDTPGSFSFTYNPVDESNNSDIFHINSSMETQDVIDQPLLHEKQSSNEDVEPPTKRKPDDIVPVVMKVYIIAHVHRPTEGGGGDVFLAASCRTNVEWLQ